MDNTSDNILGCFVSGPSTYPDDNANTRDLLGRKAELFRSYVWGPLGISDSLKKLKRRDYGYDLDLILLQYYVHPLIEQLAVLKEIERFRRKEKAIGIPIIIHDLNFFDRSELERRDFLKRTLLERLDLLEFVVKRNKLDTNMVLLKSDVEKITF